ncbi:MAG TPA: acetaldehyde dehydrogenase (acetylating) [Gaiellaceae bacterium]
MRVAILGTGNIGTDLLEKLRRSDVLDVVMFAGVDPESPGLARARSYGVATSTDGVEAVLGLDPPADLVYEATSAAAHRANAPRFADAGLKALDLTPAKVGPPVVPAVSIDVAFGASNLNLTTCGGQATVPMVAAVSSAAEVEYAEIVSTVASLSAGPGTRQNIDEFTRTTASALETIGGAARGKAIIILNPADPPILMRNTVMCIVPGDADREAVAAAIARMAARVQGYVPGYRIAAGPEFDEVEGGRLKVSVFLEVTGAGDFLPPYAGNLDIMTAAAVAVGEQLAAEREPVAP